MPAVPSDDPSDQSAASALMQRRSTFNASLECCKELVTRCPENAKEAVKHGVVSIVTTYIATHLNPPPNPAALRLLYQLVVCKEHAEEIYETMTSCLTIPALARLLDAALVHAGPQDRGTCLLFHITLFARSIQHSRELQQYYKHLEAAHIQAARSSSLPGSAQETELGSVHIYPYSREMEVVLHTQGSSKDRQCLCAGSWAAEILEVLAPLVINSQEAAEQLVTLGGMHALSHLVMHPTGDPLPLSLMLDMMEALVAMGDDSVQVLLPMCLEIETRTPSFLICSPFWHGWVCAEGSVGGAELGLCHHDK